MSDASPFTFVRITTRGELAGAPLCYQVREGGPAGLLLGSVTEEDGGWRALIIVTGKLRRDRDAGRPLAAEDGAEAWPGTLGTQSRPTRGKRNGRAQA
jgi:hypothetical protein